MVFDTKVSKMLNKQCRLCLSAIEELRVDSMPLKDVKQLVEKIFVIELDVSEEYGICPLCSEKLLLSSELYQRISETQTVLEQKVLAGSLVKEEEAEVEIKIEESFVEVISAASVDTRRTRSRPVIDKVTVATVRKKVKPVTKVVKVERTPTNRDQIDEEDQKLSEFYRLSCPECSEQFPKFARYKTHMKQKHKVLQPAVVCCNMRLNKRCRLYEHMIFHTNPDQFKCPDCDKQFQGKDRMERHRTQRHQPKENLKHQCDKCPKRFMSENNLRAHLYTHLPKEEKTAMKVHMCADCGKGFMYKSILAQHMKKVHLKLSVCICDICAKTFNSKADFLYHYSSTHQTTTMPKVQCSICQSYLLNEKCLKSHIARIHRNGGPHICNICGKVSPSSQALRSHQLFVHEKERKFKCPHCEKAFKRDVGLKEHLTTHVGGALYTCQFCDKTFNSGANMYSHRKRAHPVEHERLMREKLNERKPDNVS